MPSGNSQLKQSRIEVGFLIENDTTYQEIADYLCTSDPKGVIDLIYIILDKHPDMLTEIRTWNIFKETSNG